MDRRGLLCSISLSATLVLSFSLLGCGGGTSSPPPPPPPANNLVPVIAALSPQTVAPGDIQTLTVTGSGFVAGTVVRRNGSDRPTAFVSSTKLSVQLTATDNLMPGTAAISVFNPQPGGGVSGSLTFAVEPNSVALWRVAELALNTQSTYANPFADTTVTTRFDGPSGQNFTVTGFYDGDGVWRVRFTPVATGTWHYQTIASNATDKGLHGVSGILDVGPASSTNPLYQHGGFLRVSQNHRYLTYTDGTPFFWMGDVWWFAPSSLMPMDGDKAAFKILVDKRSSQNYSVVQMAFQDAGWGHEWCCDEDSTSILAKQRRASPTYWQSVDRYFSYAQEHGMLPVFGLPGRADDLTLDQWKFLWSYIVARYSATPVTFLIVMEYNSNDDPLRATTALALGQHIKDSDPYQRAMSVHPWAIWVDQQQAWAQPWYDFTMVNGGHFSPPVLAPATSYEFAYNSLPTRPMVDAESAFEGILGYGGSPNQTIGAEQTRRAAYYSIQLGGFGYTYGAHGLWYPTQSETDDTFWADWGVSPPWWVAMELTAGAQMQYLRKLYESVEWWSLEPRFDGIARTDGTAVDDWFQPRPKAKGDDLYLVWFPYGNDATAAYTLRRQSFEPQTFDSKWFDPQTGVFTVREPISCTSAECELPSRPNGADWVLVLTKTQTP